MKMSEKKSKRLWNAIKDNWLLINIGTYIGGVVSGCVLFSAGLISINGVILYTFITPLVLFTISFIRKSRYQRVFMRLILVIGGGSALGFPIWIFINYILLASPWTPLSEWNGILKDLILILNTLLSFGGAAYILDRLGKRRDYKPFI